MSAKKVVGVDDVIRALRMREGGATWAQVIEATGFNGATLRPHIVDYLQREELKRAAVNMEDRTDSPLDLVQVCPVELTTESIDKARVAGMAWYSIAKALGKPESFVKSLASPEHRGRKYVGKAKVAKPEATEPKPETKPAQPAKRQPAKRQPAKRGNAAAKRATKAQA